MVGRAVKKSRIRFMATGKLLPWALARDKTLSDTKLYQKQNFILLEYLFELVAQGNQVGRQQSTAQEQADHSLKSS